MKLKICLGLFGIFLFYGCAQNTVINKNYNFNDMKTIGIVKFCAPKQVKGIEDITYKQLMAKGFNVVDKKKMEAILLANKVDIKDYLNLKKINDGADVKKIDAILVGEISYFKPGKEMVRVVETEDVSIDPGTKTVYSNKNSDGSNSIRMDETSTTVSKEYSKTPVAYNSSTEIGLILKLIDVNTLDVIWVGTISENGSDNLDAQENAIKYLVKKLKKDVNSMLSK
jgi:hypothetical protein